MTRRDIDPETQGVRTTLLKAVLYTVMIAGGAVTGYKWYRDVMAGLDEIKAMSAASWTVSDEYWTWQQFTQMNPEFKHAVPDVRDIQRMRLNAAIMRSDELRSRANVTATTAERPTL